VLVAGQASFFQVPAWLARVSPVDTAAAASAALVCAWAISHPVQQPSRPATRAVIAVAIAIATVLVLIAQVQLLARNLVVVPPTTAVPSKISSATTIFPHSSLPSTAQHVRWVVTEPATWLEAILAGAVLSAVVSPSTAVRRLARALVEWRRPRVLLCGALALLLGAVPVAVATIGGRHAAATGASPFYYRGSSAYATLHFFCWILLSAPLVFAWYGFVAERLRRWMPPIIVALVIGLATSAPSLLARQIVAFHVGFTEPYAVSPVSIVAAETGMVIVAVWLSQTARDSLLPVLLFLASGATAGYVVAAWFAASPTLWVWACVALGAVVAVAGRMWRRGPTDQEPASVEVAEVSAREYEVVVKDLGMPADWTAGQAQRPDST
jgi:hypothetical protein